MSSQIGFYCNQQNQYNSSCNSGPITVQFATDAFESFDGDAAAVASQGLLGVVSNVSAGCYTGFSPGVSCPNEPYGLAVASASFTDGFTFTHAPSTGFLVLNLQVYGQATVSLGGGGLDYTPASGSSYASIFSAPGVIIDGVSGIVNLTSPTTVTIMVPFVSSGEATTTVEASVNFEATSSCGIAMSAYCAAVAQFYDTAYVTSVDITDQAGNVITDSDITTASGTNYDDIQPPPEAIAPEPSSIGLLGVPLALVAVLRRWR